MIILFRLYRKGWYYQRPERINQRTHHREHGSGWYFLGVDPDEWHNRNVGWVYQGRMYHSFRVALQSVIRK